MAALFSTPFDTLLNLQRALENARSSDWLGLRTTGRGTYPPANVFQHDGNYVVIFEIPGIHKQDIDVQIHQNKVRLVGKKSIEYGDDVSLHRREREGGNFDRTLTVPFEINAEAVKAEYRDGVLALHLPPVEAEKPRSISID